MTISHVKAKTRCGESMGKKHDRPKMEVWIQPHYIRNDYHPKLTTDRYGKQK